MSIIRPVEHVILVGKRLPSWAKMGLCFSGRRGLNNWGL